MEGGGLPLTPIVPEDPAVVSISELPEAFLHQVLSSIGSLLDRNEVALACKAFSELERATRTKLRLRRSACKEPAFLRKLAAAGNFKAVTELDLCTVFSTPEDHLSRTSFAHAFRQGLPSVTSLLLSKDSFAMHCAIESWSHLKRLEIREDPKGTKDPFWVSLALEDVLATLTSLEELSFPAWPTLKTKEEPFPGFLRSVKEKAKRYPSLTALRNCFFATDKALEVLGKAFPKLSSLELINPSLAVNNLGNSEKLTNQGIVHLDSDYPFLKELKSLGQSHLY
jgi:hypothetical protein